MDLVSQQSDIYLLSASIFFVVLLATIFLISYRMKDILSFFRKIPLWLVIFNFCLLVYKIFFIPGIFCSRNDFGVWILGMAKSPDLLHTLMHPRAPVYFFVIDFFGSIFDGVTFDFISAFNTFLLFLGGFYVFFIVFVLFKNKIIASISSVLYLVAPTLFIFSLTEDYTNPAIFFSLQALFFASLYKYKGYGSYIWLAIFSALLATGSRPEYIIFIPLFIFFLWLLVDNVKRRHYISLILLSLPKLLVAIEMYTDKGYLIHGNIYSSSNLTMLKAIKYNFFNNLIGGYPADLHALFNFWTLMGVFIIFGVIGIIYVISCRKEYFKPILFFIVFILAFIFYYCFFHGEGLSAGLKYITSLVFPLVVLASLGIYMIYQKFEYIGLGILTLLAIYSLYITSPHIHNSTFPQVSKIYNEHQLKHYFHNPSHIMKERRQYEKLSYKDRYDFHKENKDVDIDLTKNNVFLTNGRRSYLNVAPINNKIITISRESSLDRIIRSLQNFSGDIYVAQGALGFMQSNKVGIDGFNAVRPEQFEKEILENFNLKEKLISYYENKHHVFLYKVSSQ